ncbi:MAG TPA: hypothetical protein VMX94_06060 [Armatimonadota bacterium]|nr:hypothetical protein [Armatimonadota bacterium]
MNTTERGAGTDPSNLYRRGEVEKRIARGVLDGKDESELSDLLGMPKRDVTDIVSRLARRVAQESPEIARIHAIKQTGMLQALYLEAQTEWGKTHDPRYAEQMRGALSDIRKIWGVEAPQRIALGAVVAGTGGVLGGILGDVDDATLEMLAGIFERGNAGAGADGEGVPALEGNGEISLAVPVDRREAS